MRAAAAGLRCRLITSRGGSRRGNGLELDAPPRCRGGRDQRREGRRGAHADGVLLDASSSPLNLEGTVILGHWGSVAAPAGGWS